jgi:(S)-2-hydroxy-acid oxidase
MSKPVNLKEFEELAKMKLTKSAYGYYSAGADDEFTLADNINAFQRYKLKARAMAKTKDFKGIETKILGNKISSPICIAPTAFQMMADQDGECATARAAKAKGTAFGLSSWSNKSMEEVAAVAPDMRIQQLYFSKREDINIDFIKRIEDAGYKAIAVTVDATVFGKREEDIRNKFELPNHLELGNYKKYFPEKPKSDRIESGLTLFTRQYKDENFSWDNIKDLRALTKLPIILKGILCAEDAKLAVEYGVDAIWVSNHGARQLD